jgi:hypothetical protein
MYRQSWAQKGDGGRMNRVGLHIPTGNGYPGPVANDEPILRGRDENAPFRAHLRVLVVVAIVVLLVGGLIYGLFAAFHGKQKGPTMPAPVPAALAG